MDARLNHPFVVWGTCFLWLASMFAITWSVVLFFSIGDMLMITGLDVVVALILLSGLVMFPTNVFMLYTIANGQKLNHKAKVLCCPLWMLMMWIIVINCCGIFLCVQRICVCNTLEFISHSMKNYRTVPRYKRFMDNLQWSLKCCGLDSYKDWFNYDWYERIREYEWDPSQKNARNERKNMAVADSVPLSCCKSGTCVPNYLLELGTHSIHTKGCNKSLYRVYIASMNFHLMIFFAIVIVEAIILSCIMAKSSSGNNSTCEPQGRPKRNFNVKHLMPVNDKFLETSSSTSMSLDDEAVEESELTN